MHRNAVRQVVALVLVTSGCTQPAATHSPAPAPHLLVFAAASTTDALEEIAESFKREQQVEIDFNFGNSATLATQITQGAKPDLYLSASGEWADKLAADSLVDDRRDLLGNELVVIVPIGSKVAISSPSDLADAAVRHIALGDPESAPAGKYAQQALTKLNLWEGLKSKVVAGDDVRQALVFVESGEAEAGIVYATDATMSTKVTVAAKIDPQLTKPIRYPLVLLKPGSGSAKASLFYDYLGSPAAADIFRKYGFLIVAKGQ